MFQKGQLRVRAIPQLHNVYAKHKPPARYGKHFHQDIPPIKTECVFQQYIQQKHEQRHGGRVVLVAFVPMAL